MDQEPPAYTEHTSGVPYGQSTLLHGNHATGPPTSKGYPYQQNDPTGLPYPGPGPSEFAEPPPVYAPYGATPYGHPMAPPYLPPPPHHQQQQQHVVVVSGQPRHNPILIQSVHSYTGHVVLACFVTWCCCPIFGIIAFILAMMASGSAVSNPRHARSLGQASYGLSIAGIVISVLVVIIVVAAVYSSGGSYYGSSCSYYYYGNSCYRRRYYTYSSYGCRGYYYRRYCYYNTYYG